jgi:hypothetical protein
MQLIYLPRILRCYEYGFIVLQGLGMRQNMQALLTFLATFALTCQMEGPRMAPYPQRRAR